MCRTRRLHVKTGGRQQLGLLAGQEPLTTLYALQPPDSQQLERKCVGISIHCCRLHSISTITATSIVC